MLSSGPRSPPQCWYLCQPGPKHLLLLPSEGAGAHEAQLQVLSRWDVDQGQGAEGRQRGRGEKAHSLHAVSPSRLLPTQAHLKRPSFSSCP